jgi:hypothetical protein
MIVPRPADLDSLPIERLTPAQLRELVKRQKDDLEKQERINRISAQKSQQQFERELVSHGTSFPNLLLTFSQAEAEGSFHRMKRELSEEPEMTSAAGPSVVKHRRIIQEREEIDLTGDSD